MELLLKVCWVIAGMLFVGSAAVLGLARQAVDEPIAPYIEMWHMAEGMESNSCPFSSTPIDPYNNLRAKLRWCELASSLSGHVTAYFESDLLKYVVAFSLQPNQLHYGDLVRCWGEPDEKKFASLLPPTQVLSVSWREGVSASIVVPYGAPVSYLQSASYLSLGAEPLPCRSGEQA